MKKIHMKKKEISSRLDNNQRLNASQVGEIGGEMKYTNQLGVIKKLNVFVVSGIL